MTTPCRDGGMAKLQKSLCMDNDTDLFRMNDKNLVIRARN